MKVCPNNALHPAFLRGRASRNSGRPILRRAHRLLRALLRPLRAGVPHGSHPEDHRERKARARGVADQDRDGVLQPEGRCLPWSMQTPCIVCEEFCPTSPRAIWVEEVDAQVREEKPGPNGEPPGMKTVHLRRPHVDPSLCIGCGAMREGVPGAGRPGRRTSRASGRRRSETNVILLENTNYNRTT